MTTRTLIVEGRFYDHISDLLKAGAEAALSTVGAEIERIVVPGALEIPTAIKMASESGDYDAFVALGCVIRGETTHYELVAGESARGLVDLGIHYGIAIGNGILTVENEAQALVRADPAQKDKGGDAAKSALALLALKRRWQRD